MNGVIDGSITEENYLSVVPVEEQNVIESMAEANIEASRQVNVSIREISSTTQTDVFNAIRSGAYDSELLELGVSQDLIDAVKRGDVNELNVGEYRSGEKSIVANDAVELFYQTYYYSQFGEYVGGTSNTIKCSDKNVYGEEGCLKNKGRIFLAWNMRSNKGRLVGSGVYIERLKIKVVVNGKKIVNRTQDKLLGVRRKNPSR